MNIEKEFESFIEFPEGSDGLYVTAVSTRLFAKHCASIQKEEVIAQLRALMFEGGRVRTCLTESEFDLLVSKINP
jgi:hypothetical protein